MFEARQQQSYSWWRGPACMSHHPNCTQSHPKLRRLAFGCCRALVSALAAESACLRRKSSAAARNQPVVDPKSRALRPIASEARPMRMAKRESMLRPTMEKLGFTVPEAAALSSLGQTSIYKAIREGQLRIRKYGTRTIITRADLASFLENLSDELERPEGRYARPGARRTTPTLRRPSSA